MKELDQIVLQKGLFASIKGRSCLTKGYLDNSEGQLVVESPPNQKLFLKSFIYIKKKKFSSKKALLTKRPIPGRFRPWGGGGSLNLRNRAYVLTQSQGFLVFGKFSKVAPELLFP